MMSTKDDFLTRGSRAPLISATQLPLGIPYRLLPTVYPWMIGTPLREMVNMTESEIYSRLDFNSTLPSIVLMVSPCFFI